MPLDPRSLSRLGTSQYVAEKVSSLSFLATTEASAAILAAGFFNPARDSMKVGDVIICSSDIAAAGDILLLRVDAVPTTGNIVVSAENGLAGL